MMRGQDVEYACDVTLYWGNRDYQLTVTAPLCRIGIPEDGKGYNIDTLYWGGTSADWDYYINVAGLSEDEEIALYDMMEDKMACYDPKQSGYLDTLSVVGALMRRMQSKYGTLDNDIETFEHPCLLVQALAIEMCEDLVWRLFENQMDTAGTIPPEAWEYMQATFDQAITETNLFESLWSNL